ncbi:hypothetical protein QFW77_11975 [Luteimonas sp. RD2P54]|uniref:Secreted protein n=1 Tax=Luteimonas endophytica TaxID=3042023 RepID=A0ABT6JA56_9GAMM|nr:hypothetical protein [Luteimonas endophytica]MDH5823705.1 hypothetical protein [Luteimonas endophytica]
MKPAIFKSTALVAALGAALSLAACQVEKTQEGEMPDVDVETTGGQLPAYDVETADVEVGTRTETVEVPEVDVTTEQREIEVPDVDVTMPEEKEESQN